MYTTTNNRDFRHSLVDGKISTSVPRFARVRESDPQFRIVFDEKTEEKKVISYPSALAQDLEKEKKKIHKRDFRNVGSKQTLSSAPTRNFIVGRDWTLRGDCDALLMHYCLPEWKIGRLVQTEDEQEFFLKNMKKLLKIKGDQVKYSTDRDARVLASKIRILFNQSNLSPLAREKIMAIVAPWESKIRACCRPARKEEKLDLSEDSFPRLPGSGVTSSATSEALSQMKSFKDVCAIPANVQKIAADVSTTCASINVTAAAVTNVMPDVQKTFAAVPAALDSIQKVTDSVNGVISKFMSDFENFKKTVSNFLGVHALSLLSKISGLALAIYAIVKLPSTKDRMLVAASTALVMDLPSHIFAFIKNAPEFTHKAEAKSEALVPESVSNYFQTLEVQASLKRCMCTLLGIKDLTIIDFVQNAAKINANFKGLGSIMGFLVAIIQQIYDVCVAGPETAVIERVKQWVSTVHEFDQMLSGNILTDTKKVAQLKLLMSEGIALRKQMMEMKGSAPFSVQMSLSWHSMDKYYDLLKTADIIGNTRVAPVWLFMCGPSGAGKSSTVAYLAEALYASLFSKSADDKYTPAMMYNRRCSEEFWSAYFGHPFVRLDDQLQIQEKEGVNTHIGEMMALVSNEAVPLNMPDLGSKGNTYFTSKFIFQTENVDRLPVTNSMANVKAYYRRMGAKVYCMIDQKYADYEPDKKAPGNLVKGRYVIDQEMVADEVMDGKIKPWDIYRYTIVDGDNKVMEMDEESMEYVNFDTLVKFCQALYKERVASKELLSCGVHDTYFPQAEEAKSEYEVVSAKQIATWCEVLGEKLNQWIIAPLSKSMDWFIVSWRPIVDAVIAVKDFSKGLVKGTFSRLKPNPKKVLIIEGEEKLITKPKKVIDVSKPKFYDSTVYGSLESEGKSEMFSMWSSDPVAKEEFVPQAPQKFATFDPKKVLGIEVNKVETLTGVKQIQTQGNTFVLWGALETCKEKVMQVLEGAQAYAQSAWEKTVATLGLPITALTAILGVMGGFMFLMKSFDNEEDSYAELSASGDPKTKGTHKKTVQRHSQRKPKKVHKSAEGVAQAFDNMAMQNISNCYYQNLYTLECVNEEGKIARVVAFFTEGKTFVSVKHALFRFFEDGTCYWKKLNFINAFRSFSLDPEKLEYQEMSEDDDVAVCYASECEYTHKDLTGHIVPTQTVKETGFDNCALVSMYMGKPVIKVGKFKAWRSTLTYDHKDMEGVEEKISVADCFSTHMMTQSGDCGGIYVALNPQMSKKIFGVHFAGAYSNDSGFGAFIGDLASDAKSEFMIEQVEDTRLKDIKRAPVVGYMPTLTDIHPSCLAEIAAKDGVVPTSAPSVLKTTDGVSPLQKALTKFVGPKDLSLDAKQTQLLTEAGEAVIHKIPRPAKYGHADGVITVEEALNGIVGSKHMKQINMTTSPGIMVDSDKVPVKAPTHGKWTYIRCSICGLKEDNTHQHHLVLTPEFERYYQYFMKCIADPSISYAQLQKMFPIIFRDCLKDERLELEKINLKKTRLFSAGPLMLLLAKRQYFGLFVDSMMSDPVLGISSMAINPTSSDWTVLYHRFARTGCDNVRQLPGDFKFFDGSHRPQLAFTAVEAECGWYEMHFNVTDKDQFIRRRLQTVTYESRHIALDQEYYVSGSNPSGDFLTTAHNIIVNAIAHSWSAAQCARDLGISGHLKVFQASDYWTYFDFCGFGDDHLECTEVNWYTMQLKKKYMGMLLLGYTNPDKTDITPETRPFYEAKDLVYLKRSFRTEGATKFAPLAWEDVMEIPLWCRHKGTTDEDFMHTLQNAALEAFQHGRALYRKYCTTINKWMIEAGKPMVSFDSYDAILDVFNNGGMRTGF